MALANTKHILAPFLFSFIINITNGNTFSPSLHCLSQPALLVTNLACKTSELDVASLLWQEKPQILMEANNFISSDHPWSYAPECTSILPEINSELCVYTSKTFASSRGLSLLTTPIIASQVALLPPFVSCVSPFINTPTNRTHTVSLPHKGVSTVASLSLQAGDIIHTTTPILLVYFEAQLSTNHREALLRTAISRLPPPARLAYLSLATIYGDPATIHSDILKANTFELHLFGARHMAIFPEPSRINHDCAPNAQYHLNPSALIHEVVTTRPVNEGEEISIAYASPMERTSVRKEGLKRAFHFDCSCQRCMDETSDERLAEMLKLQAELGNWERVTGKELDVVKRLLELYRQEKLEAFMDTPYGYAALAYSAVGDAQNTKTYAKLAAGAVAMKDGRMAPDYLMWLEMMKSPESHWSWRWRV